MTNCPAIPPAVNRGVKDVRALKRLTLSTRISPKDELANALCRFHVSRRYAR